MKKILIFLLVLTLSMSMVFVGISCKEDTASTGEGSTETEKVAEEEEAVEETETEEAAVEPVTLTFTGWRVEDQTAMDKMNEKFTEKYPNIQIEYNPVKASEYDSYLQTALANDTAEDIIMLRSFNAGKLVYSTGYLVDLDTNNVPNLEEFPDALKAAWATEEGQSFGVPGGMVLCGLFYNKAIFEDCGITTPPKTMDELYDVCETIEAKGITPISFGIKTAWYASELFSSTILAATVGSRDYYDRLYNKEIDLTGPGYVKMLQNAKDISEYFPEGYEGLAYEDCQQMFLSEQAAMYLSGSFEIAYFEEMNPDIQLGAIAYPGEDGPATAMNMGIATGYGINKNTEHLEECLTYLNWLASAEGTDLFANNVTGFYGMNVNAGPISNEAANEWIEAAKGKDLLMIVGYECMNTEVPDYTTAMADTVYQMLVNGLSPEEAADYMQNQMSWYFK